ncbi:MAG: hypothetical protein HY054_03370 [Proteobacteria bacterium]|nr:hypothetical protein [Pseudomonadota bacterium]
MILRRVRQHATTHNWFAVSIDLLIVVLGVFLGTQVSNWNDARADRGVVVGHLSEIAQDLRSHLRIHDALYESAVGRISAVDYIYDRAFHRRLPQRLVLSTETWNAPPAPPIPEARLNHLMGYVDLVRVNLGSRQAYDSLISSGHMGMIANRELARHIQEYYGRYDDAIEASLVFREFRNDGVVSELGSGVSLFDERPAGKIIELARRDQRFAAYLRSQREWAILHANLLVRLKTETETLLREIEAERARIS